MRNCEVLVTDASRQVIEPMVYAGLVPNFEDPDTWTLAHVLRHHAANRPDAVCLDLPEELSTWTYAEALDVAERVASSMYRSGAQQGDRVALMAANSSRFVFTWWGTAVGGLVKVPINTGYEGDFLRHQLHIADARFAVIDDVHVERWVALGDEARCIEKFWVVDTGAGIVEKAVAVLGENGWAAAQWDELREGETVALPTPRAQELGAIFYTSGTTGPSKGVAMPHSQLYFFAQIVVSLTRLTEGRRLPHHDAVVPRQRHLHGGVSSDTGGRPGGREVQVQRQPLDRPRP